MRNRLNQFIILGGLIAGWATIALWAPVSFFSIAFSAAFLLLVPGYFLYRLIIGEHQPDSFWENLSYSVALSCLVMMLVGLALSVIGPTVGLDKPLTLDPLVAALAASTAALAAGAVARSRQIMKLNVALPAGLQAWAMTIAGALLPIGAIGGAFILNNGGSGWLALATLAGLSLYALWQVWFKPTVLQNLYPYAVFCMSLALVLANSMRGWFITGHDVLQEWQVFQLTATHSIWSMNLLQNAYTACLSITILPTVLAKVTGMPDAYVYKLLFQLIFALVPTVIYVTAARFLPRRVAFLSALVYISFPTFFTDMSMLGRQEIAFAFFALILMAAFDKRLPRRATSILIFTLALGMILSHYSTSYVAAAVLLFAKLAQTAIEAWNRWRKHKGSNQVFVPISWPVTLAVLLTIYLWNTQITNTSQSIASTIDGIVTSLPAVFDSQQETGQGTYSIVGHQLTNQQLFGQYTNTADSARTLSTTNYYPQVITDQYPVVMANEQIAPLTRVGKFLGGLHVPLYSLYDLIRSAYAGLIEGLILVGLAVLSFRSRIARVPLQYLLLGCASLAMIVVEAVLPNVINYGLLRLLQQSLVVLSPVIIVACYYLLELLHLPISWRFRVIALALVGFFAVNVGLLPAITGGYRPDLPVSNSGLYYEAYYTHADELAAGQWLVDTTPPGTVINSDEFARRKLIAYFNIYTDPSLQPDAISKQAYVYISYGNTVFGRAPFYYNGNLLYENTPTAFLDNQKNLLYSNGDVKIYQ